MRKLEFASVADIAGREALLKDYVHEAVEVARAGGKVDFAKAADLAFPAELIDRLDGDPALKAAFEALTPGRRRGYLLHFSQPKQSATRVSRIGKCAPRDRKSTRLNSSH